jgi:hypothetical protein
MKTTNILISGVTVLVLLSGCSSGGDNGGGTPSSISQTDSFVSTVRGIAANAPEDTDPVDIDSIQVTAPEESDPEDL